MDHQNKSLEEICRTKLGELEEAEQMGNEQAMLLLSHLLSSLIEESQDSFEELESALPQQEELMLHPCAEMDRYFEGTDFENLYDQFRNGHIQVAVYGPEGSMLSPEDLEEIFRMCQDAIDKQEQNHRRFLA